MRAFERRILGREGKVIGLYALLSGMLTGFMIRNGFVSNPDSWAYWEGSVSLIEYGRYTYLNGEPITAWPPLFSVYLSLAQWIGSQSGAWLCCAMVSITVLNVVAWGAYVHFLFRDTCEAPERLAFHGAMTFVTLFVATCSSMLLAHVLLLFFLGLMFRMILVTRVCGQDAYMRNVALLAVVLACALLTHNTGLAYTSTVVLVLLADRTRPVNLRVAAAIVILVVALCPWLTLRWMCGQTGSHAVSTPLFTPFHYVRQSLSGIGTFFLPVAPDLKYVRGALGVLSVGGLAGLLLFRKRAGMPVPAAAVLALTLLSFASIFAIFNFVWIDAPLSGRFLWYMPLAFVPVLLCCAQNRRRLLFCLLALTLSGPFFNVVQQESGEVASPLPIHADISTDGNIRPWYYLSERYPERCPKNARPVVAPAYPWMQRWRQSELPESARSLVRVVR